MMSNRFCIYLLLFPLLALSQDRESRFRSLVDKAFHFTVTDENSEEYFRMLTEAETLSDACRCDSLKLELYVMLAEETEYRGDDPETYQDKLLQIAKSSNNDKLLAKAWSVLGHSAMNKRSGKATTYYLNSLKHAKASKDPFFIAVALVENGVLHYSFGQKARAREYHQEALKLIPDVKPSAVQLNEFTTRNIKAYAYVYLTQVIDDDKKAYQHLKQAHASLGKPSHPLDVQAMKTVLLVLVGQNLKFRDYGEALANNHLLHRYAVSDQESYFVHAAQINYAMIYARLKDYANAKKYADLIDSQIDHADVNAEDRFSAYNFNRTFADVYSKFGQHEKAKFYLLRELRIMDTLLASKQDRLAEDFAAKYEAEQRKAKIANQNLIIERQASTRNLIVILSVLAISIIVIFYQRYIGRHRRKELMLDLGLKKEKEINQFRKTFFENVAHEIRTPLTLLRGYLDLAMDNTTSAAGKDYLKKAIDNSTSLLENTNDMLSLMKSEDADKLVADRIYINEFLSGIIANFQGNVFFNRIAFHTSIEDSIFIQADKSKLEKILNNLIGNALKYATESPMINVDAALVNDELKISVADSGPGIPESDKDRIFERFYQSEKHRDNGGFGIGLSMSKEFAIKMGGDITLETGDGKGCKFIVRIPVRVYRMQFSAEPETGLPLQNAEFTSDRKRYKILIVEDNPELSLFYKEIFADHFDCAFAADGVQGLKAAKAKQYDLVISDIMMPGLDGFGFRKNLREIPSYAVTPFILVSAKSLTRDKIEGFGLGVDDFISKPFNKDELIVRLKTLLANLESRHQWALENKGESVLPPDEQYQQSLLSKIDGYILSRLGDETLKAQDIASHLGFTTRRLTGELRQLTGMGLIQYVNEIRLREAYLMAINKIHPTVAEISYAVGMESTSYFNKLFKNRYGITPGELMQQ